MTLLEPVRVPDDGSDRSASPGIEAVLPHLRALVALSGSDLHCKAGSQPRVRVDGHLRQLDAPSLTSGDVDAMAHAVLRPDQREKFARTNEADAGCSIPGLGRFRVNAFRQRGSVALVFRRIAPVAVGLDDLAMPAVVGELALAPRGLVLVTGPTGSGKTTTLAAMVDHINTHRAVHVVTIEDPIEVLHTDKLAMISQREVPTDTADFATALRAAMRQDPDVVLVGEIRDTETVRAALQAAETGHLVLSTLHTSDAGETITRIIDLFPPSEQHQVRLALAGALRGIVAQRLVPRADGVGRQAVVEVCVATPRTLEAVADGELTSTLSELIAEGAQHGMQSFDDHLIELVAQGLVNREDALATATNPHDLLVKARVLGAWT